MLPIVINVLQVIFVFVSLLIILLVLMQRPKNEGLGAAFGGGATDQLFGAQTTNVLQTITRWLGGIFFCLALLLSILYVKKGGGHSPVQDKLTAPTVIPALPTPAPATPSADGEKPAIKLEENPPSLPLTPDKTPGADGNEPAIKLEQTPPTPGNPPLPILPAAPVPGNEKDLGKTAPAPEKPAGTPEPAPAPVPEKTPAAVPTIPPPTTPAGNKPAEPAASAPEPKPAK